MSHSLCRNSWIPATECQRGEDEERNDIKQGEKHDEKMRSGRES